MNAYSEDLRKKIVQALRRGMGKSQAARTFSVSLSSIKRYAKMAEEGGSLAPSKLVFVDECGTHTSLAPLYGYCPKGERLRLSVPRNRGKNTTLLASITLEGMGPSLAVDGSSTKEVFEAYLEYVLLPELEEGQVLVMDSLPAHKPNRVRAMLEERGLELLYLPSYSPDYNPIEEASPRSRRSYAGLALGL